MSEGTDRLGDLLRTGIESLAIEADPERLRELEEREAREARRDRLRESDIVLNDEDRRAIVDGTERGSHARPDARYRALRATEAWLARAITVPAIGNALLLCGPTGQGKTMAAGWALARRGGQAIKLGDAADLYELARRDTTRHRQHVAEWNRLLGRHLLVVEELGQKEDDERFFRAQREAFAEIVDRRQSRRKHLTIVTSNLGRAELLARIASGLYDPRTESRLARMTEADGTEWATAIDLKGPDLRRVGDPA